MSEKKPGWLKVAQKATGKDLAQLTVASLLEKQLFGVVDSAVGLASKSMKDSRAGSVQLVKCEKEMKEDRARMQNAEVRAQSAEDKVKNLELKVKALESKNRVLQEQRKDEKEQMQSDIDRLNAQLERFEKEVILALRSGVAQPDSLYRRCILEVAARHQDLDNLSTEYARLRTENEYLREDLFVARQDMCTALDRIHNLATLNEPHQHFVNMVMRERDYWQSSSRKKGREIDVQHQIEPAQNRSSPRSSKSGRSKSPRRLNGPPDTPEALTLNPGAWFHNPTLPDPNSTIPVDPRSPISSAMQSPRSPHISAFMTPRSPTATSLTPRGGSLSQQTHSRAHFITPRETPKWVERSVTTEETLRRYVNAGAA
ncbi:hypothetical protein CYMTET_45830 [Cymbomonas tetramitiformis]|uniref:Uncharacterized protein n=1 Tax=Cymbomonas tetramitiformis TaxID=36881 RepID=A0AAE0BZ66_9CHLO|nr:hypothetical protein CYMTET_45831 [Cymbomonas tetramitiformis]KAK3244560.1 hypothetical protein CYMTET_45830 [Cymbomonas tetramitiformis]